MSVVLVAVAMSGCNGDGEIDTYVRGLAGLSAEPSQIIEGVRSEPAIEGDYACITQEFSETRQYDEVVAYAANSDSMWPGALLRGDSVQSGLFTQTVFDRQPLTISVSLENLGGQRSAVMERPSLAAFRESIGGILSAEITGDTPANLYAEIEEVHSQEQLSLAMGAGISAAGVPIGISTSFRFNDNNVRSRYLVKYIQSYYTVDVDQPRRPSDFFASSVTLDEVADRFDDGNPPVYVSSITYGRIVLFTFESEYSAMELGSALEFVYRGGVDVSGDVSVTYEEMISQSRITAYILGGSGGDAAQAIDGYEALREFIRGGGNYSRESPGAPIAYKLAHLADNSPARLSFVQDYAIKDCLRVSQKIKVTLDSITVEIADDEFTSGDDLELYGRVVVSADNEVVLLDLSRAQYLRIAENETYPASGAPLGEGVLQVQPASGS